MAGGAVTCHQVLLQPLIQIRQPCQPHVEHPVIKHQPTLARTVHNYAQELGRGAEGSGGAPMERPSLPIKCASSPPLATLAGCGMTAPPARRRSCGAAPSLRARRPAAGRAHRRAHGDGAAAPSLLCRQPYIYLAPLAHTAIQALTIASQPFVRTIQAPSTQARTRTAAGYSTWLGNSSLGRARRAAGGLLCGRRPGGRGLRRL